MADGAMDRRTVFADGLIQPRAMKVLEQGVLVGEPPNIWLMRDTDGDLRSDRKELISAGYGRRETNVEVNANALLWGLDNRIHMAGTGADMVLRYVDRTFQVQRSLSRGQWGATQDDAGRIYRNHNESVLHVDLVATPYFARNPALLRTRGSHEALQDPAGNINDVWPAHQTPGTNRAYQGGILRADGTLAAYTAACAPTVYRGDRLPADLYGNVFVAEPTANVVSRFVVTDDGSTLRARKAYQQAEFLSSTDERFRPVYLSNAPDGTLYVVDIYRGIIQHHTYITEYLRDQIASRSLEQPIGLGRIYRVVHEGTVRDRTTLPAIGSRFAARGPAVESKRLVARRRPAPAGREGRPIGRAGADRAGAQRIRLAHSRPRALDAGRSCCRDARDGCQGAGGSITRCASRCRPDRRTVARREGSSAATAGAWPWPTIRTGRSASRSWRRWDRCRAAFVSDRLPQFSIAMRSTRSSLTRRSAVSRVVKRRCSRCCSGPTSNQPPRAKRRSPWWQRPSSNRDRKVRQATCSSGLPTPDVRPGSARRFSAEQRSRCWGRRCQGRRRRYARAGSAPAPCATCPGGRAGPGWRVCFPRPADWPSSTGRSNAPVVRLTREPRPLMDLAAASGELSAPGGRAAGSGNLAREGGQCGRDETADTSRSKSSSIAAGRSIEASALAVTSQTGVDSSASRRGWSDHDSRSPPRRLQYGY